MSTIVLFGATGYTGRLTAEALVARGARPTLAGRNAERLASLAAELGGLPTAVADVSQPASVAALLDEGDVLVTTVGPFLRFGEPALDAAIAARATYIDSTGEPPFVRRVFEQYGPTAAERGCALLTAFGYDYVPGNLAGALALRDAGSAATRVDVGYFITGGGLTGVARAASGGTAASAAGIVLEPGFAWRRGGIVTQRPAASVRAFKVEGRRQEGVSVGGTEHFALPRLAPQLQEVNVYLGWSGPLSRPLQAATAVGDVVRRLPLADQVLRQLVQRAPLQGSTGGPDAAARARTGSVAVAVASDAAGRALSEVHLQGPNGYDFTAAIMAWAATTAAGQGLPGGATGALGPVDAFGLETLERACAEAGLNPSPAT